MNNFPLEYFSWLRIEKYSTGKLFISRQYKTLLKESNSFGTQIGNYKARKIGIHYVCEIRVVFVHVFRSVFVIDSVAARKSSEHESWSSCFYLQVPFRNFFVLDVGAGRYG